MITRMKQDTTTTRTVAHSTTTKNAPTTPRAGLLARFVQHLTLAARDGAGCGGRRPTLG